MAGKYLFYCSNVSGWAALHLNLELRRDNGPLYQVRGKNNKVDT